MKTYETSLLQKRELFNAIGKMKNELSRLYEGRLDIIRYEPGNQYYKKGDDTFIYITETKPGRKLLGIFPASEMKMVLAVSELLYEEEPGDKEIRIMLDNMKNEHFVRKYLAEYLATFSEENGVTGFDIYKIRN